MKHLTAAFLCAAVFIAATATVTAATEESISSEHTPYSWYCKHRDDGVQPEVDAEMSFIEDMGACYIDRGHSDDGEDKVIYLTFDAGYENGNIEKVLDVLKEKNVKGAFFILEHLVKNNTDLVVRMNEEGHTVCNHTALHKDMTLLTDFADFESELKRLESVYTDYTGENLAPFYRPPEGKFTKANLKYASDMGYTTVLWSFAYADWDNGKQPNTEWAFTKVMNCTHNGEILLLHPTSSTNVEILPRLIDCWREMGYRFGTLDELAVNNG